MNYTKTFFSPQFLWEIVRIITVGLASLFFYLDFIQLPILIITMAFGLYSLVKTAVLDLINEKKIGTELFITIAVIISVLGKEYLAGAVVLMIILIAEYIASASTEKARASIRELIGSVPKTALLKKNNSELIIDIVDLKIGDVILVKAGEKIPVDGKVVSGSGSVNQAPITGESLPQEKTVGSEAFAGTILELGALDIEMTKAERIRFFQELFH